MKSKVWRDFGGGALYDIPAWEIVDGSVAAAVNFLFDKPPMARRRQKTVSGGGLQGRSYRLGRHISSDGTVQLYTYGRQTNAGPLYAPSVYSWTPGASEAAVYAGATGSLPFFLWAEPVMHLGALVNSAYNAAPATRTFNTIVGTGGANASFTAGGTSTNVAITVTAGSPRVQSASFPPGVAGMMIRIQDHAGGATPFFYIGRIAGVSAGEYVLQPTPTVSFTGNADIVTDWAMAINPAGTQQPILTVGKILVSWQNRLVAFNVRNVDTSAAASAAQSLPNGFAWTIAPDELASTNPKACGNTALFQPAWEPKNFDYIGSAYPITGAAVATNGNAVLVFTDTETFLLTGELTSQTARGAGALYDTPRLSTSVGCVQNRSIVNTPLGVVWASSEGVFGFDGRIRPLMSGRMARTWRTLIFGSGESDLHGAAYVNGHYLVTITRGSAPFFQTFLCNLETLAWSELQGSALDIMHAVQSTYSQNVYAIRWWSELSQAGDPSYQPATAPITSLGNIFDEADDGGADSNGVAFSASIVTGSDSANLADYESYRSHRIGYRTSAEPTTHLLTPQGGVDARQPTGGDKTLTLDAGTGQPQVAMLSDGNIIDRSISHKLDVAAGGEYFELHFLETRGDDIGSEAP